MLVSINLSIINFTLFECSRLLALFDSVLSFSLFLLMNSAHPTLFNSVLIKSTRSHSTLIYVALFVILYPADQYSNSLFCLTTL